MMRRGLCAIVAVCLVAGCEGEPAVKSGAPVLGARPSLKDAKDLPSTLLDARKSFKTQLVRKSSSITLPPKPPKGVLNLIKYPAPLGDNAAYLSPDPADGKKHPAIIWIFDGFDNEVSDAAWKPARASNDQSAVFREQGVITMYPSLRGGNGNPGYRESFMGEADDVIAAADYLAKQPNVDPKRIYLGGHGAAGTLTLLIAELTDRFRAVISFGPAEEIRGYGADNFTFDVTDSKEYILRSPGRWMSSIKSPLFVFGGSESGNTASFTHLSTAEVKPNLHFHIASGYDHYSVVGAVNRLLASKIVKDADAECNIAFTKEELDKPAKK